MWKKIVVPLILVGLLWIGGGGFTTYYIMWLQTSLASVLRESMVAIRSAGEMEVMLWRLESSIIEAAQQGRHSYPTEAREAELAFERALELAQAKSLAPEERQLVSEIAERFQQYRTAARGLLDDSESNVSQPPMTPGETMQLAAGVASPCKVYVGLKQRLLLESIDNYARLTRGVNALRLILFCSGPVIGVLLGIWVTRSLRSSLYRLSVRMQDAAAGVERDLGQVEISPTGELPALERQVQQISARLTQAAGELQRGRQEAERSERLAAAGELAAGIAHELRNPLTSIKLLVQTAARRRDQPLSEKQFKILQDEVTRMEESIQSLLDLASPPKMRRSLHNLCDALRRSLNLVRARATQNSVKVLEGLPNERIMIQGDPEQLHQVFVNLLLNALEAMPGGGTLRVAISGLSEGSACCRIKFSDTGAGIPDDMLERIFDPFVSGKENGYGLGLAVSRRIVTEHGGTITATNRPEGGALFTVALPYVSVEREPKPRDSDATIPVAPLERVTESDHVQTAGH